MLGGGGGGGGGGAGLGLDFSAVIQAAVVGLVLFSAAVVAVRRAASRYFVVDAAGFAASYDDHHHHHHSPPAYPMSPKGSQQERGAAGGEVSGPCAACGVVTSKKCSRCKSVRYWCVSSSSPPCPLLVLPCNGYGAARDLAFLPNSQRNLSLPLCDLVVGAGNRTGILASAWCSLVRESNFHNHGLVSRKIGVPGE